MSNAAPEIEPNRPDMAAAPALPPEEIERLTDDIVAALKTVYDPEIPSDIYELGLIYRVDIDDNREVAIDMTLTAPGCPVAGEMPGWVETAASAVPASSRRESWARRKYRGASCSHVAPIPPWTEICAFAAWSSAWPAARRNADAATGNSSGLSWPAQPV